MDEEIYKTDVCRYHGTQTFELFKDTLERWYQCQVCHEEECANWD